MGPSWKPLRWLTCTGPGNLALIFAVLAIIAFVPLLKVGAWWPAVSGFIAAAAIMWFNYGNPLNWWQPFFGITMYADLPKIAAREQKGESGEEIQQELLGWVKTCTKGRWVMINPYAFRFLNKGDAAMFKLAWY